MQSILDKAILACRYILVVFYFGLAIALGVYALGFLNRLWSFVGSVFKADDTQLLIDLLFLLDAVLVASLVVMVALSSYDSLVSRLHKADASHEASWVADIDPGNLKIKLATALVAISSIHLLQVFMQVGSYDDRTVMWSVGIHLLFLLGVGVLAVADRMTALTKHATKL